MSELTRDMIDFYNLYLNIAETINIKNQYLPQEAQVPYLAIISSDSNTKDTQIKYITSTSSADDILSFLNNYYPSDKIKQITQSNFLNVVQNGVQEYEALL